MSTRKTPWHLWLVGFASLLWNAAGGGLDYILSKIENPTYMQTMAETMQIEVSTITAYFEAFPLWMNIAWALGVWGAVAGSVLLLFRSGFAYYAFILSLIGIAASTWYQFANPLPGEVDSTLPTIMAILVPIVTLLLIWYSRAMARRGVLR